MIRQIATAARGFGWSAEAQHRGVAIIQHVHFESNGHRAIITSVGDEGPDGGRTGGELD